MLSEKLSLGDTIGIISPAGPSLPETLEKSIKFIKSLGFNVKEGVHIYDKLGYLSGKDQDRANDFMDMFVDKEIKMILCARGGYGSMRLLPLINFQTIKENPKIFAGFSDITTFLNVLNQKCNLITFHSPMCNSDFSDEYTLISFINTIMNGDSPFIIKNPLNYRSTGFYKKKARGKLVGGNLSIICSLLGTPFEVEMENNILFIEEVNEEPYKIDRMLTQLLLSGKIQKCTGIILGQFTKCSLPHYERSLTLDEVIEDRILTLKKPTLINFMSGHSYPKMTLPIGAEIILDCEKELINVIEPVVR